MKKLLALVLALALCLGLVSFSHADDLIKVGVVNNPPSESGYRAANVADFEAVFTEENGYELKTFYSIKNDEQLQAASGFITDGVDVLLISAAETTGWDEVLKAAQEAGIKVYLFDRMIDIPEDLYEAAVVSDMPAEGAMAVGWLLDQKLDEYKVVHIQGAMGSDAQLGRTGALDEQFAAGTMTKVVQQTATWDEAEAKKIVESVINSGEDFNVIYAENDGMARGAVAALDEAGITHGKDGKVVVMGFDCNKFALREVLAGNRRLLESEGVRAPEAAGSVLIARDGVFIGSLGVRDDVKPTAKGAIEELKRLGLKRAVMLSGDNESAARETGSAVGLSEVHAGLLPEDKVELMKKLNASGRTLYTGDGINDAPVLASADVGIAMGGLGSDAAIETADVVIMDDDLNRLPRVIRIGRKTRRIAVENIAASLAVKFVILGLGIFVSIPMYIAILGDVGVLLAATMNALRALKG